jgi:Domain of unknown function DUF29
MSLYDDDFYAWIQHQATLLRAAKWQELDYANLAEEIESLGRSDRRQLKHRLEVLIMHLLKWQYQPEHRERGQSWSSTIREQRNRIHDLLEDSSQLASASRHAQPPGLHPSTIACSRRDQVECGRHPYCMPLHRRPDPRGCVLAGGDGLEPSSPADRLRPDVCAQVQASLRYLLVPINLHAIMSTSILPDINKLLQMGYRDVMITPSEPLRIQGLPLVFHGTFMGHLKTKGVNP